MTGSRTTITRRTRARPSGAGFTLLETAMTLVIIGVGVLSMVEAQAAFIQSNLWSSHAASGNFLAQEVREFARNMSRHDPVRGLDEDNAYAFGPEPGELTTDDLDDLDDLDGMRFGFGGNMDGPINALGEVIPEINIDGTINLDADGNPEPMNGWAQTITVEKVEPEEVESPAKGLMLSTSKLARDRDVTTKEMFRLLTVAGLISESRELTDLGRQRGGVAKQSKRFGDYITWPSDISLDEAE